MAYLLRGELPQQEVVARQIIRRAKAYVIIDGELYKRSVSGVFQWCVSGKEGRQILKEIHEGDCGHHASTRSLVAKAFRHGFFWHTAQADAERLVSRCDGCQRYARQVHVPAQELRTIPLTWPFAVWGLDMVCIWKGGPANFEGDSRRRLWSSRFNKVLSGKSIQARFLLAYSPGRCRAPGEQM